MLEACLPLGPCVTSNWTFWPSLRVLKPFMLIAEKWANKSSPPSSGVMKPKPLESLNHLTVPVAIKRTFKIKTNHTSHKSKKLLAPSSTSHFLSSCTYYCNSRYRIVGGINIEVKRFSTHLAKFFTSTKKATLDFGDTGAICAVVRKRVRLKTIGNAQILRMTTTVKALE